MATSHVSLGNFPKSHIIFGQVRRLTAGTLLWSLAITSVISAAYVVVNQIHFARVLSGSMQPQLERGDVLVLKPIDRSQIAQGQIVMLPSVHSDGSFFVHRIVDVKRDKGTTIVRTKGDANPAPDPVRLKITSQTVPLVTGVINMSWAPMVGVGKAGLVLLFGVLILAFGSIFLPQRRVTRKGSTTS